MSCRYLRSWLVLLWYKTSKIGYYVPQMYVSAVISSIAAGLIYRFSTDTSSGLLVGQYPLLPDRTRVANLQRR